MAILVGGYGSRRRFWLFVALVLVAMPAAALGYFTTLDPMVMQRFVSRFGKAAGPRLNSWREMINDRRLAELNDRQRLEMVNRLANRIPYVEDMQHWGVNEYWATPAEFVASNGGDCDDYAIAKYFLLLEIGLSPEKLRMTYVRALHAQSISHHMVLAYYPQPDADPLILDNLADEILPAARRPDLLPVLSFNDMESWAERGGRQKTTGPGVIRQWSELRQRMMNETLP